MTPCYIVTERVANELESASFTGFELNAVEVITSDEFKEMYPGASVAGVQVAESDWPSRHR